MTTRREKLATKAFTARMLVSSGMLHPVGPRKLAGTAAALRRWGPSVAAGYAIAAVQQPNGVAIVDERGQITFADAHRRTNALARAWGQAGLGPGDGVAILCRNHRGIVEATVACAKLGANAVFLNTAMAGPQIAAVCEREQARAIVYDEDLAGAAAQAERGRLSFVSWSDGTGAPPRGASSGSSRPATPPTSRCRSRAGGS